ncbi:PREDICTED: uncharacterized protein LOC108563836 [Nicrophorus vespilloides]|uniref:Uncharacterized protein LOC108563836 n=1 Tax=Nicrophorus vespilloides TaxID=110193 RepID=A0ABM1MU70_NICVS|nr:PREDICTED: uncharacterized protein LOC108563836 [Nicrophorus vespilloides]
MDPYDSLEENEDERTFGKPLETVAAVEPPDLSTILPLYGKETCKSEVKLSSGKQHHHHRAATVTRPPPSRRPNRKQKPIARKEELCRRDANGSFCSVTASSIILEAKPKKSYLDIFHARIGYIRTGGNDTTRAVVDPHTDRKLSSSSSSSTSSTTSSKAASDSTEFVDAKSFVSDSSSFYLNHIEVERRAKRNVESGLLELESGDNLRSVSEARSHSNAPPRPKPPSSQTRLILEVPALGRLGPDPEVVKQKMIKFKRQQTYGQRASNENRIRMMEKAVLKNFNLELKKSANLSKCTETLLKT